MPSNKLYKLLFSLLFFWKIHDLKFSKQILVPILVTEVKMTNKQQTRK